eukprot:gene10192-10353_t
MHSQQVKRPRDTEMLLKVTLEELYMGCTKQVSVPRTRHDALTGCRVTYQECLQVQVQPGVKEGTRITFPGLAGERGRSDLTLVIEQQLHPSFRRLADDLYVLVSVPLVTALTGGPVQLKTLSGQLLQLPVDDNAVITPGSELVVPDHGMPVFGDRSGRRGALHVKFKVNFPQHLSQQQQLLLRRALAGCESPPLDVLIDEKQFTRLRLPADFLPQIHKGVMELGDMDDPLNCWFFGQRDEIFKYRLMGTHPTMSGFISFIEQQTLRDICDGSEAAGLPEWDDFRADLQGGLIHFPSIRTPFLFADLIRGVPSGAHSSMGCQALRVVMTIE